MCLPLHGRVRAVTGGSPFGSRGCPLPIMSNRVAPSLVMHLSRDSCTAASASVKLNVVGNLPGIFGPPGSADMPGASPDHTTGHEMEPERPNPCLLPGENISCECMAHLVKRPPFRPKPRLRVPWKSAKSGNLGSFHVPRVP